jgi:hypothetical protein
MNKNKILGVMIFRLVVNIDDLVAASRLVGQLKTLTNQPTKGRFSLIGA